MTRATLNGAPFQIYVRPTDLLVRQSHPPPDSGPGFASVPADRVARFGVVPRDRYDNVRCRTTYNLADMLSVQADRLYRSVPEGSSPTSYNSTAQQALQQHDAAATWPTDPALESCGATPPAGGATWTASLTLTIAGVYSVAVKLGDPSPTQCTYCTRSLSPVPLTDIPRNPNAPLTAEQISPVSIGSFPRAAYPLRVIPAWADPDKSIIRGTDPTTDNCVARKSCRTHPQVPLQFTGAPST
eukprot:SAG11_NODE_3846_length_2193_cov_1.155205_3_plen_242_part_00